MHDATKILMGAILSSSKTVSEFDVDPAGFLAGRRVQLADTGLPSLLKSAGMSIGISLGRSLSNTKKTAVGRDGLSVPVRLSLKRARGTVTITSYANLVSGTDDAITINGTAFTAQAGAATPGDATFRAATGNNETAASLAAQINAHATIGALVRASASGAVVTIAAVTPGATGNDITLTYTDNDTNVGATLGGLSGGKLAGGSDTGVDVDYVVKGAKVYFDDISGDATDGALPGSTISDAIYVSGELIGINEDSSETPAALVDMPGGL
jgi:hypothetical protein